MSFRAQIQLHFAELPRIHTLTWTILEIQLRHPMSAIISPETYKITLGNKKQWNINFTSNA